MASKRDGRLSCTTLKKQDWREEIFFEKELDWWPVVVIAMDMLVTLSSASTLSLVVYCRYDWICLNIYSSKLPVATIMAIALNTLHLASSQHMLGKGRK